MGEGISVDPSLSVGSRVEEEDVTESLVEESTMALNSTSCDQSWEMYRSLQYSFFSNSGVEVIGGFLFLITAIFIVRDKLACELAVSGEHLF